MATKRPKNHQIRECENPACLLRYPLVEGHPFGERCPVCLGPTHIALERPLAQETDQNTPLLLQPPLEALLDNIRSAWNVGAIFRTADGLGVQKLHLCGITPTPENSSVGKTALGADKVIPWTYARNAITAARQLKAERARLWALEQDERAVSVNTGLETDERRIVLIIGNEVSGVDPGLVDMCERIVSIPMQGVKRSLNVEVAFGVAVFALRKPNNP